MSFVPHAAYEAAVYPSFIDYMGSLFSYYNCKAFLFLCFELSFLNYILCLCWCLELPFHLCYSVIPQYYARVVPHLTCWILCLAGLRRGFFLMGLPALYEDVMFVFSTLEQRTRLGMFYRF